ncbi:hypothetical protein [Achromobacter deleyi]|uniref:hypothetical protein n=1 Tax=Achromobacter deleyi TaxID=1353891 RepID=UPI0014672086|nr:hypothetical protein [Achromobacter deleyi]CAB3928883.1 hypothetical protein LMG3412_06487 [Achromobacter deleyi]
MTTIPAGYKLVPIDPTAEMWAAVNKLDDEMAAGSYDGKGASIEQVWNCLVDAAPGVPAVDGWLDIASAPKTGRTLLLGYWNFLGKWRTVRGQWMSAEYIGQEWEEPDGVEAGWFETAVEADDVPNCWPIEPTHWMPLPAAPGAEPGAHALPASVAPGDAQDDPIGTLSRDADETIRFTPARDFLVTDGMPVFSAPAAGDAQDAARWRFVRRKLCLTGNGDGTCAMQAINLPASIPGWPEPGSAVAEFCDAAIDAAIEAQRKGDA